VYKRQGGDTFLAEIGMEISADQTLPVELDAFCFKHADRVGGPEHAFEDVTRWCIGLCGSPRHTLSPAHPAHFAPVLSLPNNGYRGTDALSRKFFSRAVRFRVALSMRSNPPFVEKWIEVLKRGCLQIAALNIDVGNCFREAKICG